MPGSQVLLRHSVVSLGYTAAVRAAQVLHPQAGRAGRQHKDLFGAGLEAQAALLTLWAAQELSLQRLL